MIQVNLQMPKACDVCPFNYDFCWCKAFDDDDEAWEKVKDDWNLNVCEREERPEYCPLKEVITCKNCKYVAPDMVCGHPNETLNPLSRNDGNPDWSCADAELKEQT